MLDKIKDKLKEAGIDFECNVPMARKTWIHRGPVVPLYIIPDTIDKLQTCIEILLGENVSYKVIGHTSNLYMLPTYQVYAIIGTTKLKNYTIAQNTVIAETGVGISSLSAECVENGVQGFEGLVGLPGTVGAAVINNASCYRCAPSKILKSATILEFSDGKLVRKTVGKDYFQYTQRSSAVKRGEKKAILLEVTFHVDRTSDINSLRKRAEWVKWHRDSFQEGKAKNLGSIFSSRIARGFSDSGLSPLKYPLLMILKMADKLWYGKLWYWKWHNSWYTRLYGYGDITPYVSTRNDNCFVWKDEGADKAFPRYQEFMHKCYTCGALEIEILK